MSFDTKKTLREIYESMLKSAERLADAHPEQRDALMKGCADFYQLSTCSVGFKQPDGSYKYEDFFADELERMARERCGE